MLSFHVKFVQTNGRTDGWTDGRTTVKQYAPDLLIRGHKKLTLRVPSQTHTPLTINSTQHIFGITVGTIDRLLTI